MKPSLALLLILCASPAYAIHETVFAANAADSANNRLLANPPLPMLRYSPGKWKLGLAPYLFMGKQDFTETSPSGEFTTKGDYEGWGMGGSASWAFAERWGLYAFGIGSRVTGKNLTYTAAAGNSNAAAQNITLSDARASAISLSVGVVHQFFGAAENGFVLPVFAGPMLKSYSYSHRVVETNRTTGVMIADYDVSGDGVVPGLLVGAEAGIDLGKSWGLNPFLILGILAGDELEAKVTQTRLRPAGSQQGVNRLLNGEKPERSSAFGGLGANLVYRPWGISANLTSPWLPAINSDLEATVFSLSWAFGSYTR